MIPISEIFGPTIQGEGALIGRPTVFVRTGGCDYQHCSWCDTLYAVLPEYKRNWTKMTPGQIMIQVKRLSGSPMLVTLSGGNPAIHKDVEHLIDVGCYQGYTFTMETQGSIARDWFGKLDCLTLSPKPPSSCMSTDWSALDKCVSYGPLDTTLKVVVFNDDDFNYACNVKQRYPGVSMYLQVGNHDLRRQDMIGLLNRYRWLIDRVNRSELYDVHVLPQLHVLLWGNQRGV